MGLLSAAAVGGAAALGGFGADVAEKNIQSLIMEDRMKRLEEHRVATQEAATIRGEQRKIANDATVREQVFQETKARAPELRQIKVDDAMAVAQAEIKLKTDPKNVELIAAADAAKAKYAAVAAKDLQAELLSDPKYLANMKAVLQVEHPERFAAAAASAANAAKARFELETAKDVREARLDLAAAQNAGDPDRVKQARDILAALEGTAGRAQQTADASIIETSRKMLDTLERDITSRETNIRQSKTDIAADPNSAESKAKASNLARMERELAGLMKERDLARGNVKTLLDNYQREYGARTKPAGLAETPKPDAAAPAAEAKPAIEYERGPDGKLRPKQTQK